ncbi:alpha/beta hydrolase family protein [Dyadobacter psychrotolerans]|uniref:Acetyl xylan esterase domain-containing protein n=1 Tax=Dyadobacter psychrotolerans TaxID=2541721 RepID=A0A4V6PFW4_9BACT|nr:acetylxylan esterase [Dyadobacter psychrotolerans]TDE18408.1 hypothetical protein E0F88_02390 [Dyadobacter psychrotolerans]
MSGNRLSRLSKFSKLGKSFKGYRFALSIPVFLFVHQIVFAQENANALAWRNNIAYNTYLLREVHQQFDDRKKAFSSALSSKKAMEQYRDKSIERYRSIVGSFPAKSDLKVKITGTKNYQGFTVENILFQSTPGRYVTANLYLPDKKGPSPGILILAGHGMSGKGSAQKEALILVQNGFAALTVDPVGQGERVQLLDGEGKAATRGSTTEHTLLNAGANLTGTSVAMIEYWDNHRALDYLETRPEVDKNKLGCIGSSGGGTQTTYMLGLDERIKVAVVCSYVSKRERVLELNGPSDGCQHIPYEGREGLELADFLLMFSPKPLLIMSGLYDFVDYVGAQQTFGELKEAYKVLGEENKVSMFTAESGHGMPRPKREAATSWFRRWFYQDNNPVQEKEMTSIPEKDLLVTNSSQVLTDFQDGISTLLENKLLTEQLATTRSAFVRNEIGIVKAKVLDLLGIKLSEEKITIEQTGTSRQRNFTIHKYQIAKNDEIPIPVVVIYPEKVSVNGKVTLYLNENGKAETLASDRALEPFINRGDILVLADLRGFGETADPLELNDTKYWNKEYRNAMTSMHIGKPVMGQRVTDILSVVDFINSDSKLKDHKINLVANGAYGPAAIHAAYLDKRISQTEISRSFKSFEEIVKNPMQRDVYSNVLYGVLKYYDLKDLVNLTGNGRIRYVD